MFRSAMTVTPPATISVRKLTSPPSGGSFTLAMRVSTLRKPRKGNVASSSPFVLVGSRTFSSSTEKK